MTVTAWVGKKYYDGTTKDHAEKVMFNSGKYDAGDFTVSINAWPCVGADHAVHNCHRKFLSQSVGRIITVIVSADDGAYSTDHGKQRGATGRITYNNGVATIT